jgi:TonB family protein
MKRFFSIVLVSCLVTFTLYAQTDPQKKRGMLPPGYSLPKAGETVHFTSPAHPEYQLPEYPADLKANGTEGALELELYVSSAGEVLLAEVSVSSGDAQFDDAALNSALQSRFPAGYATVDGMPRDFKIAVPYYFLLSNDPELYWHTRLELSRVQQDYETVMHDFQEKLGAKRSTASTRLDAARKQLEAKVSLAKMLHRTLAEKKESAILRLRDQIAFAQEKIDGPSMAEAQAGQENWRNPNKAVITPKAEPSAPRSGVITVSFQTANGIDGLQQELEIKKSYM